MEGNVLECHEFRCRQRFFEGFAPDHRQEFTLVGAHSNYTTMPTYEKLQSAIETLHDPRGSPVDRDHIARFRYPIEWCIVVDGRFLMAGRHANSDKGAALVEMAIALPLLIALLTGLVSVAIAYNRQLALTHSARESGRQAATLPVSNFGSLNAWLDAVAASAVADATGSLAPGTPGLVVCVAYVHPDGIVPIDSTLSRLDTAGFVTNPALPCFTDGRPDSERRVQVRVARETELNVVFFNSTITIDSEATNRFEAASGL